MISRGRLVNWCSLVSWGSMSVSSSRLWGVDCGTFIRHLSNESVVVVSSVGGGLDSAIRKSNGERSSNFALSILSLSLLEVVLGVVINNSVLVGKWLRSKLLNWGSVVWGRGSIGWGASSSSCGDEGRGNQDLVHFESVPK